MAHSAKLDENNVVTQVVVVNNAVITDENDQEVESLGVNFLRNLYKEPNAVWKKTSYNHNERKNFAGIGDSYDETRDAFIPKKPYASWVLNETTCRWDPPVTRPEDTDTYGHRWNEETQTWDQVSMV
jgi:hypothetical protein